MGWFTLTDSGRRLSVFGSGVKPLIVSENQAEGTLFDE